MLYNFLIFFKYTKKINRKQEKTNKKYGLFIAIKKNTLMRHQNLLYYENALDLDSDYPNGNVDSPVPGVAYAADIKEVIYNNKITRYEITVNYEDASGTTLASSTTMYSPDVLDGNRVKVTIRPIEIEGYITPATVKIRIDDDYEYTFVYEETPICYVDLGLPSGTLWACNNLGASNPEDMGYLFAWGETEPSEPDPNYGSTQKSWNDYVFSGSVYIGQGGNLSGDPSKYNSTDNKETLESVDDAAHAYMGGEWHIPTIEQAYELDDYTTRELSGNSVIFTSNINGNQLVLPFDSESGQLILFWLNHVNDNNSSLIYYAWSYEYGCEGHFGPEAQAWRTFLVPVRGVLGAGPDPSQYTS